MAELDDEARLLRDLKDRLDIQNNLSRYTYGCDLKDYELLSSAFLPDASIDYDSLPPFERGFPDFLEAVRGLLEQLRSTQHFVGNLHVQVDGDRAVCVSYVQATHVAGDGRMFVGAGRYDDDLVRTAEGWRIAARVFRRQWGRDPDGLAKTLDVGQRPTG